MAPVTVFRQISYSEEHLTPTLLKLRKPIVEKLRRDRINTSIEQLKALLGPEFLQQQPDSKQEKADILEMAVSYLRCWKQQKQQQIGVSALTASGDGYSHCVQEAISFLSQCKVKTQSHGWLLSHFHSLQASGKSNHQSSYCFTLSLPGSPVHKASSKGASPANCLLWRPW